MPDNTPTAVLTKAQREYLRGEREPTQERTMKTRIRGRVHQAILDLELIQDALDDDEIKAIATSFGPEDLDDFGGEELAHALRSTVAIAYRMADTSGLDGDRIVADGVEEGKSSRLDVLQRRFEKDPESLTLGEYAEIRQAGVIDRDEERELLEDSIQGGMGAVEWFNDQTPDEDDGTEK